ncbi:CamS family sex pheromone protein [Ligilactobacillus equi]|uniref:CamS family sex pheromone protein n=1 Tax=Ligilactobacillus equi TaxID=137357 RepID=UPI000469B5B3|nr:CamS family sex pheromone protein [Ligilactobacillus equi]
MRKSKKLKSLVVVGLSVLLLTACGNLGSGGTTNTTTEKDSNSGYQTTGSTSGDNYAGVIVNGRYRTNKSRGVGIAQNSDNLYNLKSFESGLTEISKNVFSTKSYVFQEGQILSKSTVQKLLSRKSKSNKIGLNPVDNGKTDPNTRNPMYVQQIEEQDYMKEDGDGKLSLAGMTIGIGMNRKDYYQKEEYGATYTSTISKEEMVAQGKKAAQAVLERLRSTEKVPDNVPIVIAMYQQAENDSLAGGAFYAYTVVKSGDQISSWNNTDLATYVFPTASDDESPNSNDEAAFNSFKKRIQGFFPNLAGVTAQVQYKGSNLQGMKIKITTQFYSETEINSFAQYVTKAAKTYLPSDIPVEITILGSDGDMQALVSKDSGDDAYYMHVFSSY